MNSFATDHAFADPQLLVFAAQLEEQRRFRLEQLRQHQGAPTPTDQFTAAVYREISEVLVAGARAALADIEAAQRRLLDDTYGRCIDCGELVALERLEVLPYAARCLPCDRAIAA